MSGERNVWPFAQRGDYISGAVKGGIPPQRAKLLGEPRCAFAFKKRGRRNAAELEVHVVDPLLFPREPLQSFADGAFPGDFAYIEPHHCRVRSHSIASVTTVSFVPMSH